MKWTHLVLLVLFAGLMFGGTFVCSSHDKDDKVIVNP